MLIESTIWILNREKVGIASAYTLKHSCHTQD